MKIIKLTVAALALLSSITIYTEAYAGLVAAAGAGAFPNDGDRDNRDLTGALVQQNEGIPDPDKHGRCVLINRPVADVRGKLLGYQTINVCH